jgi:cellulose synthase/poly-beta-1,6-N-acetylglucosamine synthase-like glycosyltransferase
MGVAWCTGSGYAMRRSALESIGRFPTGSLAEDVCTSSMLLGRGWKTAYIHEPLQWGTVPDGYGSHLKQRTRWTVGTIQTAIKLRFFLYGPLIRKMTVFQRLSGFVYTFSSLFNIFTCMSIFAMPIVLASGGALIAYANDTQLRWLLRACFIALACNRLNELVLFLPAGYKTGQRGSRSELWMAPCMLQSLPHHA